MADYSELVKDIDTIRSLIRAFYVFGYKSRLDYDSKSPKTYDNDKRRIESYFDEMLSGIMDKTGKRIAILFDGDTIDTNPFYRMFKSKSFTDNDLILHFLIIDVLQKRNNATITDILSIISEKYFFQENDTLDVGILRLKLNEYKKLGLVNTEKKGNKIYYSLSGLFNDGDYDWDAIKFFREVNVLGVIGSYITDRLRKEEKTYIKYKHRQLFGSLDSVNLLVLLNSIAQRVPLTITRKSKGELTTKDVIPLKILINRQNGRQYLAAYDLIANEFLNYRIDRITTIKYSSINIESLQYDKLLEELDERFLYTWNVNFHAKAEPRLTEMTVLVKKDETFILNRLKREGHGGTIQRITLDEYKYSINLYDPSEILPWVKTFIGRITSFSCDDRTIEEKFYNDIKCTIEGLIDE